MKESRHKVHDMRWCHISEEREEMRGEKFSASKGQTDECKSTFNRQPLQKTLRTWSSCRCSLGEGTSKSNLTLNIMKISLLRYFRSNIMSYSGGSSPPASCLVISVASDSFLKIFWISCFVWMLRNSQPDRSALITVWEQRANELVSSVKLCLIHLLFLPPVPSPGLQWKQFPPNYQSTFSHCSWTAGAICRIVCVWWVLVCIL